MNKNRILIKVIASIVLTLIILTISFQLSILFTERKMERYVDDATMRKSFYVNLTMDLLFQSREWVISSFLAGVMDLRCVEDSVMGGRTYHAVITQTSAQSLTADVLYQSLNNFCNYNNDVYSCILLFEPHVLRHFPDGIAAKCFPNNQVRYNMLDDDHTIFNHHLYRTIKRTGVMFTGSGRVSEDSLYVFTTGIPIFDEHNRIIGEFWVDTEADRFSELLRQHMTEDDVSVAFIDKKCHIIASYNNENNGKPLHDVVVELCGRVFPDKWYAKVQSGAARDTCCHFKDNIGGEIFYTFILPVAKTNYRLLIIKSETFLYNDVREMKGVDYCIMIAGLMMVTVCLFYLFRTFKRKNDDSNRMENELLMAASIQKGVLPTNAHLSPACTVYGFQRPAKMVGGDLYDFVIKGDLLHFCIGDVSGKGMPAALVMTELSSLYRYIICQYTNPYDIVTSINKALIERSDDTMFCTLFVGVLNLKTGLLRFCNAGHNPPIWITDNQTQFLTIKANMPIYAFDDYPYVEESIQLSPADRLFLYTDGITEAKNKTDSFYGNRAALQSVERHRHCTPDKMIEGVWSDLQAFANQAEQHDDITMLCVEYNGYVQNHSLHYDHVIGHVPAIIDAVLDSCQSHDDLKLRLAIEETIQNIADYAYTDTDEGDGPLDIDVGCEEDGVVIVLRDIGKPFDPTQVAAPDISAPIEQRHVGGLGIFLTRQIMADVSYRYENNQNIVTLIYKII